ncbi:MAG: N-acetylmuramoyl-L-alanine amidase [Hyphomicrobiales bacterium]|nr:N-acetylmuramoyl-L-alanine amidase [Hyphomicrobiales bacterium]
MIKARCATALVATALLLLPAIARADPAARAVSARLRTHAGRTVLTFDLTAKVKLHAYVLAAPDRVVIDLPEVDFVLPPQKSAPADGLIKSFRYGLMGQGRSRIVIDLSGPARIEQAKVTSIAGGAPSRLVIALAPGNAADFARAAASAQIASAPPAESAPAPQANGKPLVVLDPGHGGIDSGAIGPHGIEEKNITLAFARRLRDALEATGKFQVVMTRQDDHYVSLSQRVHIAEANHARLFLSMHADILPAGDGVHGATIYMLSTKASDAQAARMARDENSVDSQAGLVAKTASAPGVNDFLDDLATRETRVFSHIFARDLAAQLLTGGDLNKNPMRSANFEVLRDPGVPGALLELGYLSSKGDVAKLTSPPWRKATVALVADAIIKFFEQRGLISAEPASTDTTASVAPMQPAKPH